MSTKTKKEYIKELVTELLEIESINSNIKGIKEAADEEGYNSTMLLVVAKSLAKAKLKDLEEKTEEMLELIKEVA